MAKGSKFDGIIVKQETRAGYVYAYDKNGRLCWNRTKRERVVLVNDLRKYASGLHIGQLGWTIPQTTDGYKCVEVQFDNGIHLPILTYGLERVDPEKAQEVSAALIREHRGTRFDADPDVAQKCLRAWIQKYYEAFVGTAEIREAGQGPEEVYAFTFPSLRNISQLKAQAHFPMKIGYTTNPEVGSIERIRQLMNEPAGFPERPELLLICRTHNGRAFEMAIHEHLRSLGRKIADAAGREWFNTNPDELSALMAELSRAVHPRKRRPVAGASPGLTDVLEEGNELVLSRKGASVSLQIRPNSDKSKKPPS